MPLPPLSVHHWSRTPLPLSDMVATLCPDFRCYSLKGFLDKALHIVHHIRGVVFRHCSLSSSPYQLDRVKLAVAHWRSKDIDPLLSCQFVYDILGLGFGLFHQHVQYRIEGSWCMGDISLSQPLKDICLLAGRSWCNGILCLSVVLWCIIPNNRSRRQIGEQLISPPLFKNALIHLVVVVGRPDLAEKHKASFWYPSWRLPACMRSRLPFLREHLLAPCQCLAVRW